MLHPAAEFGAEKYLLEEMSPAERDAFEEHCFTCPECAAELRTTASFLEAARRGIQNTRPISKPTARRPWRYALTRPAFLSPAFATLLLIILGYQAAVYPRLHAPEAPEILPVVSLVGGDARGAALPSVRVTSTQAFIISLDIPGSGSYRRYSCTLINSSDTAVWTLRISEQAAKDSVSIRVPGGLPPGTYAIRVQGKTDNAAAQESDLARYRFSIERASLQPT